MGEQAARSDFAHLKEDHRRQKRALIVAAAAEVFAERGFEGTSVVQIAKAAGVSPASIYTYFDSREELLFETSLAEIDDLEERMQHALDDERAADEVLRGMVDAYFAFYRDRPHGFRMLVAGTEATARAKAAPALVAEWDARALRCLALLERVVRRGMDEGTFAPGSSWELAHVIWGAFHGILQLAAGQDPERFITYDIKRTLDRTVDALLEGIGTNNRAGG